MDPLTYISDNHMIFFLLASIVAILWSINRFFRRASKESKFLKWLSATTSIAIFGVIIIVLNDKPHLSWFTFLSFLILAIVMLIKPFKEFPLALTASLSLLIGLVEAYLWAWESFELVQDIPMRIIGMIILGIVLVFFLFAFIAEKLLDTVLGIISWSPAVAAIALICLAQTLLALISDDYRGLTQEFL
ncbi:MAG: hypothetical protein ACTSYA_02620 [Candidatus Kariarchaeaceae archaeon]